MAGEDQDIKIGVDAGKAISELNKFENAIASQATDLKSIISVMQRYNDVGQITDTVIKGTTASGKILEITYKKMGEEFVRTSGTLKKATSLLGGFARGLDEASVLQRKFTGGQAAVVAALGQKFSQLPQDATQASIEALERQQKTLARLVAGRKIKGGAEAFIQQAVGLAESGVFSDRKGVLGNIEREVFRVVQAFDRVQLSSKRAQDEIRRKAEEATNALKAQKVASDQLDEKLRRSQSDAVALTALLRESLRVDFSKLSVGKVGSFNNPLNIIQSLIGTGKIGEGRVQELFDQLKSKQQTTVNNAADRAAVSALTALIRAQEAYNAALDKTIQKQNEVKSSADRRASASGFQQFLINRFGGVRDGTSQQQLKSIQAASNQVAQLISSGQITRTQFNKILEQFEKDSNIVLTGVQGKAVNAMRALNEAVNSTKTPLQQAVHQLSLLGLTWQGLGRLFLVQVIHSSIARIIGGLEQATTEAAQFSIRVAEIRTLTEGNAVSARTWSEELRRVSDSFGIDLLDTAAGAYEILSNQVAKGTNAIAFLTESAVFAKVTVSSLADASNLLASAVNAYKDQSLTATRAAEVLFTTIDLGRVRVEQIADTFGNVLPLGSQLGISFEEINAAFATLTIQGIRADTSMTLLNNIMLKLLRPTKEMRSLLHEWGVDTGQAAISTFGFTGVIQKLIAEFESGGIERIGDIAQEMRTIRGLLSLSGKNSFATLMENTNKTIRDSAENFRRAKEVIFENPGNQFQREVVQFRNFLTQDIGASIFQTAVKAAQAIGGVKNALTTLGSGLQGPLQSLTSLASVTGGFLSTLASIPGAGAAIPTLSAALGGLSTAFLALKANSVLATIAQAQFFKDVAGSIRTLFTQRAAVLSATVSWQNLGTAIRSAGGALVTVGLLAFGAFNTLQAQANQARIDAVQSTKDLTLKSTQALFEAQSQGFGKFIQQTLNQLEERNRVVRKKNAELVSSLTTSTVELTQETLRQNELIRKVSGDLFQNVRGVVTFDFLINGEKDQDAEKSLENIADAITKSVEQADKLAKSIRDVQFENQIAALEPIQQTQAVIKQIDSLQTKIFDLFASRNLEGVRDTFTEINELIKNQLLGTTSLDSLISKAQERLTELSNNRSGNRTDNLRNQIAAAEKTGLQLLNLGNLKAATTEFEKADKLFESMQQNSKKVTDALRKLGVSVPNQSQSEESRLKARVDALKAFQSSSRNPNKLIEDSLRQQLRLEETFQQAYAKRLIDYRATILASAEETRLQTEQVESTRVLGQSLQTNFETHNQTLVKLQEQLLTIQQIGTELDNQSRTFIDNFVLFRDGESAKNRNRDQLNEIAKLQQVIADERTKLNELRNTVTQDATPGNLRKLADAQKLFEGRLQEIIEKAKTYKATIADLLQEQQGLRSSKAKDPEATKELFNRTFINGINPAEVFRSLDEAIKASQEEQLKIQKQSQELLEKFSSTGNAQFLTNLQTFFGTVSLELDSLVTRAKDFRDTLATVSTTITPTQFGNGSFAPQIRTPANQRQAPASIVNNNFTIGDVLVQVEEAVTEEDFARIGRGVQRAVRQGLIPKGRVS